MKREDLINKFNEMYQNKLSLESIDNSDNEYNIQDNTIKLKIKCNKCKHIWPSSIKNVIIFRTGCYQCCKGKGYSMDEMKILNYIMDYYIPKEHRLYFRHAENGGQITIVPEEPQFVPLGSFIPPRYYQCDGYSRITYQYDQETKTLDKIDGPKGTVFEVLGDYHHSNPYYYEADKISPRKGMTHRQNYEYTINRLKHIEGQGYKMFYIWITDFRRYTRALEQGLNPHIFDYMNVEKKYSDIKHDSTLLPKSTQNIFRKKETFGIFNKQDHDIF